MVRRIVLLLVLLLPVAGVGLGLGATPALAAVVEGQSAVGIGVAVPEQDGRTAHASSGSVTAAYGVVVQVYGFSSAVRGGQSTMSDMGGSVYLQRQLPGGSWTNVDGPRSGGGGFADQPTDIGTAAYRTWFTGGRTTSGDTTTVYPPAYSPVVRVDVTRRVRIKRPVRRGDAIVATVKVAPTLAGRKVAIQVRHHHRWQRFVRVRLNEHSAARLAFPATTRGILYNVVVPGDGHFSPSRFAYRATLPSS